MNIDDIKEVEVPEEGHILDHIFSLQRSLMAKYEPIEKSNGVHVPDHLKVSIDDKGMQIRLKDMFWRTTEEFAEAYEEMYNVLMSVAEHHSNWELAWDSCPAVRHFFEELVDSLHFLTEATIIAGISVDSIRQGFDDQFKNRPANHLMPNNDVIVPHLWEIIVSLGLAANCLKNKPWKQTQMPTDRAKFHLYMIRTWDGYFKLWSILGANGEDLFKLYFRKHEVNKFRQRSNY
jgi:hypothetical protein